MAQKVFYKTFAGSAAENYEKYFVPYIGRPLAFELIEAAAIRPGERVLDVACGTGIVTRLAARRAGPTGTVHGLDMNPGMLAVARSVAPADVEITWHESTAESMPLPDDSYDVITSQLGLQFMTDKVAALSEMCRVLAPGGRLALSVTGPTPPPFIVFEEALSKYISPEIGPFVHMVFSLNDPQELEKLAGDAGFRDISVHTSKPTLRLSSPEEFIWQYIQSTPLEEAVSQADEATLAQLEREVVAAWEPYVEQGAMTVSPGMLTLSARC